MSDETAQVLLGKQHPWLSGALLYAGVAGVLLSMSGLIAGYVDNRNVFAKLSQRIAASSLARRLLSEGGRARLGAAIDHQLGAMAGNIFLGLGLGAVGPVGAFLGLPLDIRHIAFSAAHAGYAVLSLNGPFPIELVAAGLVGVALIGFVNFTVSFGLTLLVALESRRVSFGESGRLVGVLLRRLLRRPWDFVYPPPSS